MADVDRPAPANSLVFEAEWVVARRSQESRRSPHKTQTGALT